MTVRTHDPVDLAGILSQLPMADAHVVDGSWDPQAGTCRVRAGHEHGAGFLRYAIPAQGYGDIVEDATA